MSTFYGWDLDYINYEINNLFRNNNIPTEIREQIEKIFNALKNLIEKKYVEAINSTKEEFEEIIDELENRNDDLEDTNNDLEDTISDLNYTLQKLNDNLLHYQILYRKYKEKYEKNKIKVLAIMGKSGVGKSTVIKELCKNNNYHYVKSYSTRKVRKDDPEDKNTHIFVDNNFFEQNRDKIISLYESDKGYKNWTDINSFDKNKINIYAIDPIAFRKLDEDKFTICGIYLDLNEQERINRLNNRGAKEIISSEEHLSFEHIKDLDCVIKLEIDKLSSKEIANKIKEIMEES